MRKYECCPVGKPEKAKIVCVSDDDAYIRGLKPVTRYEIKRGGNLKIGTSDADGNIRIGVGYLLDF